MVADTLSLSYDLFLSGHLFISYMVLDLVADKLKLRSDDARKAFINMTRLAW